MRLVVRHILGVNRRSPIVAPAAVATVAVAVDVRLAVGARQQRRHHVRLAWWRRHQEGLAALSSRVSANIVVAPDVVGERPSVRLVEEGVDQGVDPRGDVTHPHKDVEKVVKQRLVARVPTQHGGDVGDEEWTPHDEKEEEDDSQDLEADKEAN